MMWVLIGSIFAALTLWPPQDPLLNMIRILAVVVLVIGSTVHLLSSTSPWPRSFDAQGYTISIYEPETTSAKDLKMTGRSAFSIASSADNTVFGAIAFEAVFTPVPGKDSVELTTFTITGVSLPDSLASKKDLISSEIRSEVLAWKIRTSKKALSKSSSSASAMSPKDLKNDPPIIIVRERPSILIMIDGDPKLDEIKGTSYQYVKNSITPIVFDPSSKLYYVANARDWYQTKDLLGEWTMTTNVPKDIRDLIKLDEDASGAASLPNLGIVVATKPSELLSFDGSPQWEPLPGNPLLYAKNTESDVFKEISSQKTFVLISGRWFSAASLKGPWTFVPSDKLPAPFKDIPADGPKGKVRPAVAGTAEADQAVLDAIVPQTTAVDRSKATITVTYDGDPWFQKIEGTSMEYAVNTKTPVIHAQNMYYACDNGIWFISPSPNGPWAVSDKRPDEIDKIPSSNPVSNVKYVYVYNSTPTVVYVGYVPAYYGTFIYHGVIVYGTGWHYNPWYGPHYYPRPYTYGFHVHYSRYYGWGGGYSYYHPPYHPYHPPAYRPPPYYGRPPGAYPRPPGGYYRPNYPNHPNVSPRVPTNAVNRPSPAARPSTRPSTPTYRPTAPTTRPSTRPASSSMSRPSTSRPSMSRPSGGGGRRR